MRQAALLIAAASLVACAKTESAKPDSGAAAGATATPAAPAAVTAADMTGGVSGKVMMQNSDSVLFTFTCTSNPTASTTTCTNSIAPKDTVHYTYTLSGADSVMFTSAEYTPPAPPKSPKVIDHVVGHLAGNKWTGTTTTVLAAKPDSVFMRTKWEATKTP